MRLLLIPLAFAIFLAAGAHLPYQWTHTLSATCYWSPKPWMRHLGSATATGPAWAMEDRCWAARGAHDPDALPDIKVLLKKWPSQAQLDAWKGDRHENKNPFPAIQ